MTWCPAKKFYNRYGVIMFILPQEPLTISFLISENILKRTAAIPNISIPFGVWVINTRNNFNLLWSCQLKQELLWHFQATQVCLRSFLHLHKRLSRIDE